jgi:predicted MFS family arabinose efflux permease
MNAPGRDGTPRLFTYEFIVLTLAAAFGFCNIAVFYGLATHLERIGVDPAWRGAVIAAEPLAALLARPLLSLRLTARHALPLARLSLVALGLALNCYQFAVDLAALLAVRVFHGLAFVCLVSAVMVLIARVIPPKLAGRGFGYFSLSALIPYALMPPLAEWMIPLVGGEAKAYAFTALLTLPSLALLAPLGAPAGERGGENGHKPPGRAAILANLSLTPILLLLGANLTLFTGVTLVFFYLKPLCQSALNAPGLFFSVSTAASLAVRALVSPFFDRLPRRSAAAALLVVLAAAVALMPHLTSHAAFIALAFVHGVCLGAAMPLINAAMFLESSPELRGANMNLMLSMMDAGYTLGPLIGGAILAGGGSFAVLFACAAGLTLTPAALLSPLAAREWRGGREGT